MRTEIWRDGVCIEVIPDPRSLDQQRSDRLGVLADRRWRATQRFTYDGVETQADPAISAVTAAVVSSQFMAPGSTRTWKLADGAFRTWSVNDIVAFGMAISAHVQACFNREADLAADIAGSDDPDAIDIESGWPS